MPKDDASASSPLTIAERSAGSRETLALLHSALVIVFLRLRASFSRGAVPFAARGNRT